jgi:hypothetical protein
MEQSIITDYTACAFDAGGRGKADNPPDSIRITIITMKMQSLQKGNGNRVFWLGMVLCTLYQSYRYPLQINATGTSPTYSDTPLILQAGKFVLAFPLFAIALVQCLRKTGPPRQWLFVLGALFLSCYSLLKVFGDRDARYLDLSFWLLFALTLVWALDAVEVSALDQYLRYLLFYALGSTLIEVVLFFAFGRLPALAFEGTYLIRFGGFLDDPNGFSAILFLLLGWSYLRFKGWTRFFILTSIIASLLLTQSWTGLAFLVLVLFFWLLGRVSKRPVLSLAMIGASALLVIFVIHVIPQSPADIMEDVLTAKQGSIEGHLIPWTQWFVRWTRWALLGDWSYNPYESWWAGALINFGVPWLCVCLVFTTGLVISIRRALARATPEARPVYLAFFLFGCYFVFGSLNLPLFIIFPINFFFFLFSFLVAFGKIRMGRGLPLVRNQAIVPTA